MLNYSGLLGPERHLGIYFLEVCRIYVLKAVNSILIINILRSSYIFFLNYESEQAKNVQF